MLGSAQLYDASLRGDHRDFLIGIVLVLIGFLGLFSRYFVVDDNDENDHQDHGIGTTGTVPAMTMSLSTSRSWLVLIPLSSSDQSPS
ncbi:unnamed protein product [Brassica oleracea]|uniref:Uncharacterized protein n=1 Tax=Brassica oleracea TaxID=3712 RepID=A0A3P6EXU7_BRAOL|nr:unnamed protein product [Brassica oleracea]